MPVFPGLNQRRILGLLPSVSSASESLLTHSDMRAIDGDRALGDAGCSIFCVDVVEMEIRDDDNILGSIANTPKTCEKRRNENLAGIVVERVSRNSHIPA